MIKDRSPTDQDQEIDKDNQPTSKGQVEQPQTWHSYIIRPYHVRSLAKYCPLAAAVLAPLSTLLDIPALTQHWYTLNGVAQPDPTASLALSAVGLALNVFANAFLILRFSSSRTWWWHHATQWSLMNWILKVIVAAINLILFGIVTRNSAGYQFAEGFWCAVVSIIDAGIISIALIVHYFFAFGKSSEDTSEVRSEGKRFMISVTIFLGILALQSLVFCKIEHWAYSDSIYFSVQTALTIGFGDFSPTTTAGKVLVFPFSVLTISQLGNEIALIIGFISQRANERRDRWKKRYETAMHQEANSKRPHAGLLEEMALIHRINSREEMMSQVYDLFWSAVSLVVFWVSGAAIFSSIEGWPYGILITVMILSLTIGFGDYTPVQPAGKVVFIVYALMAVPIVTSFAVQTITGLLSTVSNRNAEHEAFERQKTEQPESFNPHSDFVLRYHDLYADMRKRFTGSDISNSKFPNNGDNSTTPSESHTADVKISKDNEKPSESGHPDPDPEDGEGLNAGVVKKNVEEDVRRAEAAVDQKDEQSNKQEDDDADEDEPSHKEKKGGKLVEKEEKQLEKELFRQLMDRIIQLEAEARQMLLDSMSQGVPRTLLLADRNVQIRDVRALRGDDANLLAIWRGEEQKTENDIAQRKKDQPDQAPNMAGEDKKGHEVDMLLRVRRYRDTFAEVLVLGSILQKLEGDDLNQFERWREQNDDINREPEERWEAIAGSGMGTHNLGSAVEGLVGVPGRMLRRRSRKNLRRMKTTPGKFEGVEQSSA
ncbi:hypothetical protein TREMEDRAFT_30177 [Tremella mesenterica DSM 1558]|uniref:uncharacterized protein n=1 Tax=Tremella mesenterica (strain ATCC 24925 / CBS 8224 / DSM 1558 / NBRC 9311 / NRRL Y-6157 / RJB 2259-6 / UBC 559-6) TaxID=578456 RepID=UPI0003F49FCD|nr:uncharacterized protein TREMEDRAFT_30177 [Tremella mesenterica DSM 1558]EIW70019.1 hypothetical protein TREMEDRAFT_30177 [Tremella mesenterica DSM 1558]